MVDLHIHSMYSDGAFDLKKIIELAEINEITYLSITDHDNIESSKEMPKILSKNMYYIPGVELSTVSYFFGQKMKVHILGYGYDKNNLELNYAIIQLHSQRAKNNYEYIETIIDKFPFMTLSMFDDFDYGKYGWISKLILNQVSSNLSVAELNKLKEYLNDIKPIYTNYNFRIEDAIQLIKNAGGYAIIAHPFKLNLTEENFEIFIKYLKYIGIDGIETYHNEMPIDKIEFYKKIAKKYNLYESGGSDFHSFRYDSGLGTINREFNEESPFIKKLYQSHKNKGGNCVGGK